MNDSYNLNRRPLNEVVRKHGSSKLFLSAIIISIVSVALNILYSIFSAVASFNTSIPFVDLSEFINGSYYVIIVLTAFIAIVNSVFSFVQYGYLYSAYSFFSGRSGNPNALKAFTKVFLAQMIITIVELPVVSLGTFSVMDDSYGIPGIKEAFMVIVAVILIPIIAGVIVLSIFQYKGIKKSVNHAMAAYENRNSGKLSIFVLVMTFIAAVSSGYSIVTQLVTFAIAPYSVFDIIANSVSTIVLALSLTAIIMFIVLMFRFKSDMEIAKQEWYFIEQQKAQIRAREYAASQQAQANNSFDNTQI